MSGIDQDTVQIYSIKYRAGSDKNESMESGIDVENSYKHSEPVERTTQHDDIGLRSKAKCFCGFLIFNLILTTVILVLVIVFWSSTYVTREAAKPSDLPTTNIATTPSSASTQEQLQALIGSEPQVEVRTFTNWAESQVVADVLFVAPTSLLHVQQVIRAARKLGLRIRAVGAGYSWSPLFADPGHILMSTLNMTRHDGPLLELNPPNHWQGHTSVTVSTSVRFFDFDNFLISHNLTQLTGPGSISPTVVGSLCTSSHGSGSHYPIENNFIVAMRVINSEGELKSYNVYHHKEAMRALVACLGMCGIIYDVTITVYPIRIVAGYNKWATVEESLYNSTALLQELSDETNMFVFFYWAPLTSATESEMTYFNDRGHMPTTWKAEKDHVWIKTLKPLSAEEGSKVNVTRYNTVRPLHHTVRPQREGKNFTHTDTKSNGDLARMFLPPGPDYFYSVEGYRHSDETIQALLYSTEIALKDKDDFANTIAALKIIVAKAEEYAYAYPHFPVATASVRVVRGSEDCLLCTNNYGPETTGYYVSYVELLAHAYSYPLYTQFTKEVLKELKDIPSSRPTWPRLIQMYGKDLREEVWDSYPVDKFICARQRARLDPDNMFVNQFLEDIFYKDTVVNCT
ncbi:uncharacterized protein LOC106174082 [Lingula anatina]|uniref:Uncharacterized protein LOC106174082 n=1 Tax=Lingula anatina TaxID=7574 RepID=A0A1S3JKM2_LINAN|nr:uncharacterized protein LOC106174082 [Lingula anatina]|eukprot:XP_013410928.1 uncharacterized protein LOC106174082 [Lingula anatina]